MKLCKNCKFFFEDPKIVGNHTAICQHFESQKYDDPVYGNHSKRSCETMRSTNDLCGMSGVLWIAAADFTPMEYPQL